jgi:hypothetical protein
MTAFDVAAEFELLDIMGLLVNLGGFEICETHVIHAILSSRTNVVWFLLSLDFDINRKTLEFAEVPVEKGRRMTVNTIIDAAIVKKNYEMVLRVMEHDRFRGEEHDWNELMFKSIWSGDRKIFDLIVGQVGNGILEAKNKEGDTVLVYACMTGQIDIVSSLSEMPDFTVTRAEGLKAIGVCIAEGHSEFLPLLGKIRGVDLNGNLRGCKNIIGGAPPILEAMRSCNLDAFRALLSIPSVNLNVTDELGIPLLFEVRSEEYLNLLSKAEGHCEGPARRKRGICGWPQCIPGYSWVLQSILYKQRQLSAMPFFLCGREPSDQCHF